MRGAVQRVCALALLGGAGDWVGTSPAGSEGRLELAGEQLREVRPGEDREEAKSHLCALHRILFIRSRMNSNPLHLASL